MVEHVEEVRVELELNLLGDVGGLKDSDIRYIRVKVAEDVSSDVTEGCTKDRIRGSAIGDEAHLTLRYNRRWVRWISDDVAHAIGCGPGGSVVKRIQANQCCGSECRISTKITTHRCRAADIPCENANLLRRGVWTAPVGPKCTICSHEREVESRIIRVGGNSSTRASTAVAIQ